MPPGTLCKSTPTARPSRRYTTAQPPLDAGVDPAPCDTGCPHRACCAQGLACTDFERWTNSGRDPQGPRIPTRAIYLRIYGADDARLQAHTPTLLCGDGI